MKKTYSTVLALLIATTVGMHTTTAQAGQRSVQETLNLLTENPGALETEHQNIFDTIMNQLTDNNAGNDYIDSDQTPDLMITIITKHDNALKKFLALLATPKSIRTDDCQKKCHEIIKTVFAKLMNNQQLVPAIKKHLGSPAKASIFKDVIQTKTGIALLLSLGATTCYIIAKLYSDYQYKKLTQKTFDLFQEDPNALKKVDKEAIDSLAKHNPFAESFFVNKAVNDIETVPSSIIKRIYKRAQASADRKKLDDALGTVNLENVSYIDEFFNHTTPYYLYEKGIKEGNIPLTTQSERHLHQNKKAIKRHFSYLSSPNKNKKKEEKRKNFREALRRVNAKEKEEQEKGNYTFVHGQRWEWNFCADIFKKLYEIKNDEQVTDYQFLRFDDKNTDLTQEITKREQAMKKQDTYNWEKRNKHHQEGAERLFMNLAFFGNAKNYGSCSASYFYDNRDFSKKRPSAKDLLENLGFDKEYYEQYEEDFIKIEKLHKKASSSGNLLLISLTPEQMKNSVIPADWSGQRIQAAFIDGKPTDDITEIMDALKNGTLDDSSHITCCMMLTDDLALDPHNGPKIFSFNAENQEETEEYIRLRDDLFERIAHDVAVDRKKLKLFKEHFKHWEQQFWKHYVTKNPDNNSEEYNFHSPIGESA